MDTEPDQKTSDAANKLGSEDLAALIVDALLRANVVREADVARAVKIATDEIEVRKSLGDY
jgi:hypothetical protein